jgi:hypothetical protein
MGIEGKVIKIIDTYKLAINKGKKDGIKENDRFIILEKGEELLDPDTNESLGYLEIPKLKMKVIHIQEKISILESDEIDISFEEKIKKIRKNSENIMRISFLYPFSEPKEEEIIEKIPHRKLISINERKIKIGDIARKIN